MNSLLTARQAAELLGISQHGFYGLGLSPTIAPNRRGAKWSLEDIEAFVRKCRLDPLPRREQLRRIAVARLDPNPTMDRQLTWKSVTENKVRFPYSGPAVYFLFVGDDLVYIGKSLNLLHRVASHFGQKEFDHFSFITCTAGEIDELERRAIVKFRPPLNRV